jgi:Cu(I)/Ag(I) efflux system membrane protein CusA/SilA
MGLICGRCSRVYRTFGMAIETAMIMTIYLNEAMNKMVENMAIAVRQLPRTSSDSTLLMAQKRLRPKLMTVSVSIWISTHSLVHRDGS